MLSHPQKLLTVGSSVGAAHDEVAHRVVSDGGHKRVRRSRVGQRIQVLRERRPRPPLGALTFERPQVVSPGIQAVFGDRSRSEAIRVDQLGSKTLRDLGLEPRIPKRLQRCMCVHVDESRAEHQPGGIEHFPCGLCGKARFDRRDATVRDAYVGSKRRAAPSEDQGSFDQKVKRHSLTPYDQPQPPVVETYNIQHLPDIAADEQILELAGVIERDLGKKYA